MKKIVLFLILLLSISNVYAVDERITDFYFGNGVWNTKRDAEASKDELKRLIKSNSGIASNSNVNLAYNWHKGQITDVVETFYQMKEEGQIDEAMGFLASMAGLAGKNPFYEYFIEIAVSALMELGLNTQAGTEDANIQEILNSYQNSINGGHKVVLISHSQGNLFGIRSYDKLKSWQKKYFWQVSVASPASRVVKGGGYVTVDNDMIISLL